MPLAITEKPATGRAPRARWVLVPVAAEPTPRPRGVRRYALARLAPPFGEAARRPARAGERRP